MVPIFDISLFSADDLVKQALGIYCNHGISALASLFVIKNTIFRNCLIWRVYSITMCLKTVYNVTAILLWPRSLDRNGIQLFVIIIVRCRAIRSCIMEISILFLAICRGRHFGNNLTGIKHGQTFIAKIIISQKDTARIYEMLVLLCLLLFYLFHGD